MRSTFSSLSRRRFLAGAAGLSGATLLAACGVAQAPTDAPVADDAPQSEDTPKKEPATVNIRWIVNVAENAQAFEDGVINRFREMHPDIDLTYEGSPYRAHYDKMLAELAAARAAALEAQHPGAPQTVAAAAEAEALADIDMAGTMVLSPATGLLAASELFAGASVEAGAVVAEVQHVDAGPPNAAVSLGSESPRVRPGMKASIALTIAGASHPVVADGFVATVGAAAEAELVAPPPEFAAGAALPPSSYECSARIVTGSYRPIDRLLGRS